MLEWGMLLRAAFSWVIYGTSYFWLSPPLVLYAGVIVRFELSVHLASGNQQLYSTAALATPVGTGSWCVCVLDPRCEPAPDMDLREAGQATLVNIY